MSSTLNGDFLQFITPYYIRSSCESEVPVPMTLDFNFGYENDGK